jgi:hypothetical protein
MEAGGAVVGGLYGVSSMKLVPVRIAIDVADTLGVVVVAVTLQPETLEHVVEQERL